MNRQGYMLIALGQKYIDEAEMFVKTLRQQNDNRPVSVLIKTEEKQYAEDKNIFNDLVEFNPVTKFYKHCTVDFEKFGTYPKINLIRYSRYKENIFVDTDVLCQTSTEKLWDFLSNRKNPVASMGTKTDPNWHWGHINEVSEKFGRPVPHIHGGFLYFRNSASDFFDSCDRLAYRYDELGCKRLFRGGMCDEIIFALAHAENNYLPIEFDEFPIMTFNYSTDIELPSKLQTHNNKELEDYIPFIHMCDRTNIKKIFKKIMK